MIWGASTQKVITGHKTLSLHLEIWRNLKNTRGSVARVGCFFSAGAGRNNYVVFDGSELRVSRFYGELENPKR